MKDFENKVAAITGAGSGIGRGLAINLAREGCHLAVSDVNEEGLSETVSMLARFPVRTTSHVVDVSSREQVHYYADEAAREHGGVNMIFNNAGVGLGDNLAMVSYEDLEWIFGINLWGVIYGTKAFLPYLWKADEGYVINVSSVHGMFTNPYVGPYCTTKFAVRGFTETLWQELKGSSVGVSCVHPGGIKTGIARSARIVRSPDGRVSSEEAAEDFDKIARTSADKAAKIILKGVSKNKKRILVGADAHIMDFLLRMFPVRFTKVMAGKLDPSHISL